MRILIATRNNGKLREYGELLGDLTTNGEPVELVMLDDLGIEEEVEETGATFEENAVLKAVAYARESGLLTLADDSGLEVAALGGAPGVRSARYAGPDASDADRYRKLLSELQGLPPDERAARFVCAVAVSTPAGVVSTAEGTINGAIALEPRGSQGFGYDPVFYIPGLRMTMAEAGVEVKNRLSHRAEALRNIRPALEELLAGTGEGG